MILMKFAYFFWYETQVKEINKKKKMETRTND